MKEVLHLYWLEPKYIWQARGSSKNRHLYINYSERCYKLVTNPLSKEYDSETDVEVKRKTDIECYAAMLDAYGFEKKAATNPYDIGI